jgi:hypothetical protein
MQRCFVSFCSGKPCACPAVRHLPRKMQQRAVISCGHDRHRNAGGTNPQPRPAHPSSAAQAAPIPSPASATASPPSFQPERRVAAADEIFLRGVTRSAES